MKRAWQIALTWLLSMMLFQPGVAQISYPMITYTHPLAVQRGQSSEVEVAAVQNLFGAYQVLVEGGDVQAEIIPPKQEPKPEKPGALPLVRSIRVRLTPKPDALTGPREFRVATSLSISSVGQLLVVEDPVIVEQGVNNARESPNKVSLPGVICGRIEAAEDVDWFAFEVKPGQTLSFLVYCARLQDKIHDLQKHADPILTLYDSSGRELASNDDFYFADPYFAYHFKEGGTYYLQIRDAIYDGDPRWVYAICITDRPYATGVYPLALPPGKSSTVELLGPARQTDSGTVSVPQSAQGIQWLPLHIHGKPAHPVGVYVSSYPTGFEQESNDTLAQATPLSIPVCVNGRIQKPGDVDCYKVRLNKGQALRCEVLARRFGTVLNSPLDASLDILDSQGRVLATNDDTSTAIKDPSLTFTPQADGEYVIRVRDLFGKGGETFVYALELAPALPDFTLRCDGDKAWLAPGGSMAWYVHVNRLHGFSGPVSVAVRNLPEGVTVHPLVIPPNMTQGVLVLTASPQAKRAVTNIQVVGVASVRDAAGKEKLLERIATPIQEIYLPGGGRGRFDVNMHTVAVVERADVERVEVTPQVITLKPGEEVKIAVRVHRHPEYKGNIGLDVMLRHLGTIYGTPLPPGVTLVEGKSKTLLGQGSEGHIVLRAAPDAPPCDQVPISVLAQVSINFVVKISYSSSPILLSISPK
ncbi:MAG: PPC domain-containing protein [Gemmatales bacterium]|nr:PPC domain-containing protein [Gemmatales bacterium]MDW8221486.1 PPC domain-containing protein [Gemmatales bacterium]